MSTKNKPEPPEVYYDSDLGRPATTCCAGIPILYQNRMASCGTCKRYFPAQGAYEHHPQFQSKSPADTGQPGRGFEIPQRSLTGKAKQIKPAKGQAELFMVGE